MPPVDIQPGQLVADCRLVRLLGSGGEGQVWEAERQDGSTCAMKLVLPEVLPSAEEVRDRGRWLVRINHPAMVTVTRGGRFTGGDLKNWGFVEMELVLGTSLQNAPPDPNALEHLAGVGEALDLLHQGVWSDGVPLVHRDVKPGNLIATDRGLVLVDPSTLRGVDARDLTRVGTPAYVAPEVSSGVFDTSVDVYSFAATAAALLTGLRGTQLRALVDAPINSGLPAGVVAGLHIDPRKRPQTCAEVVSGKILARTDQRPVPEGSTIVGRGTLIPPDLSPTRPRPVTQGRGVGQPGRGPASVPPTQIRQRVPQTAREHSGYTSQPGAYGTGRGGQSVFSRHERIPARRPVEVAASSGSDWEGASRVSPLDRYDAAPLQAWGVLSLLVLVMALALGWFGVRHPEIGLSTKEFTWILGGAGIWHVLVHLFNRRPLLGVVLPTYAWGAAMGDTCGTHRYRWVMDVASGWFTAWAGVIGVVMYARLFGPHNQALLNEIAAYPIPDWVWVAVALVIWFGALLIRSFGRAFAPIHFLARILALPFQIIGGLPRWIFNW